MAIDLHSGKTTSTVTVGPVEGHRPVQINFKEDMAENQRLIAALLRNVVEMDFEEGVATFRIQHVVRQSPFVAALLNEVRARAQAKYIWAGGPG